MMKLSKVMVMLTLITTQTEDAEKGLFDSGRSYTETLPTPFSTGIIKGAAGFGEHVGCPNEAAFSLAIRC